MSWRMSEQPCPRLIEVALPIREISAESVRDKNIHHAHISHLHIWWARRPLAASRAVVFASLVPDPDDPACPKEFRASVEKYLKKEVPSTLQSYIRGRERINDKDPYAPYEGIPDTLRNRLLCFIAKWSPEAIAFEKGERDKDPAPKELLDDRSLVKWETSDPDNAQGNEVLKIARKLIRIACNGSAPSVIDPFAGGGAIPLEAARLGAHAIANDYNPVAYLILRATCEFPQRYGKPGKRPSPQPSPGGRGSKQSPLPLGEGKGEGEVEVPNVLVHDIEYWANWILARVTEKIAHLYPIGKDGRPVIGYLWVRTAPCSNTTCKAVMPLMRSLILCNKSGRKVTLTLAVNKETKSIRFGIAEGKDIKRTEGTKKERGPVICPFCQQPTSEEELRIAGQNGNMKEQMTAVIVEGKSGKIYREVEDADLHAFGKAKTIHVESPKEPIEEGQWNIKTWLYGMKTWGSLFNQRQLVAMQTFIGCLHEALEKMRTEIEDEDYRNAIGLYLGLWIDRVAAFNTNVCRWATGSEISKTPFGGQAIPIIWDYPEVNPLADSSGTPSTQLRYMLKVIEHECTRTGEAESRLTAQRGTATKLPFADSSVDCAVTDPPYYDAIAYADLSDFFYVWLKRSVGDLFPDVFATPLTPKGDEATSLKHRHGGSAAKARDHYEKQLSDSFSELSRVLRRPQIATVMFAHQSTEAWTALISSLFKAGLTPDATWPIATEMPKTALALGTASLETSVTVICRPRSVGSAASFKDVRKEIERVVQESVKRFWGYGFRGADLIVACYGPAVGVFGKYERVEKADGTPVEIPELLEFARKAARDAIAGEFKGDNLSTLYYVWANLYGAAEQAWDDARMVVQIGGDADDAMQVARNHGIFVVDGAKCRLALLADRKNKKGLGADQSPPLIDALHHALFLWQEEKRGDLVNYLSERGLLEDDPFWKLTQALFEVLPHEIEDWKLVHALLGERETLKTEAKRAAKPGGLF